MTAVGLLTDQAADMLYRKGVDAFERGEIERSLEAFDALIVMRPDQRPQLWQRGISLYYAKRLEECVAQFESHRGANPDDVENSVWHYLCVAALEGEAAARDQFFPARDPRIPMMAVHRLYAGKGSIDDVFADATRSGQSSAQRREGSFYAHLYVALWFESRGDAERTRRHLEQALDGSDIGHFMEVVARVHLDRLKANEHWAPEKR